MRNIHHVRRQNARRLMRELGGPAAMANLLDRDPSYISQILGASHSKSIGDRMARHIEISAQRPEGWLDEPHDDLVEATKVLPPRDSDFVTLCIANIKTCADGEVELTKDGSMGGVPRSALEALGITPDEALLVEVHGEAHGLALPDGSLVAVNTTETQPREGKVYAIQDFDMLRVRILVPEPGGGLILRTFNRADYPDEHLDPAQVEKRITVLGRVFWSATRWQ